MVELEGIIKFNSRKLFDLSIEILIDHGIITGNDPITDSRDYDIETDSINLIIKFPRGFYPEIGSALEIITKHGESSSLLMYYQNDGEFYSCKNGRWSVSDILEYGKSKGIDITNLEHRNNGLSFIPVLRDLFFRDRRLT